jgi:hypothetical protein
MHAPEGLAIRSYRVCFALERRIHRVDRWRIPVPYGVPLRGIAYAACALAAVLVAQGLPLLGTVLGAVHPAIRLVIAPVGIAVALCRLEVDGRPAHRAAAAWLRYRRAPARSAGFRPAAHPGLHLLADIALAPDELGARLRPGVVAGPATVTLRYPSRLERRGRALVLSQRSPRPMWRGKQVVIPAGSRLVVR